MSAAISPEIYATIKLNKGEINIKPQFYTTIKLTKGKLNITPQIYATIIPAPKFERIKADTCRIIKKKQGVTGDTLRKIGKSDSTTGDTSKIVVRTEETVGDTNKTIVKSQTIIADTLRVIFVPAGTYFKPFIWATIKFAEHQSLSRADTMRRLAVSNSARADTLKQIGELDKITGDTCKIISNKQNAQADTLIQSAAHQKLIADTIIKTTCLENVYADTLRRIEIFDSARSDTLRRIVEKARADTLRIITKISKIRGDTIIRIPHVLNYAADLSEDTPSLVNSFRDYGLTSFNVTLNERTLSDDFRIESVRPLDITDAVQGQLLDYKFNFLVEETNQRDLIQSIKGMYDVDKLLYSQIYSEGVISYYKDDVETIEGAAISQGHITKEEDGEFVYAYATASDYISDFAKYLGLTPNIHIEDFTPYNIVGNTNVTYRDLLNSVFSWTSRLPQRQINVFIRGDTLHCIQRGMEESVFDISELPHSRPQITKKIIRSLWNNSLDNDTTNDENKNTNEPTTQPNLDDYTEEEIAVPFSGTIGFVDGYSSVSLTYSKGLLISERNAVNNSFARAGEVVKASNTTTYEYQEIFPEGTTQLEIFLHKLTGDHYISKKTTKGYTRQLLENKNLPYEKIDSSGYSTGYVNVQDYKTVTTHSDTEYIYKKTATGELYLYEESETTSSTEETVTHELEESYVSTTPKVLENVETTINYTKRQTFHIPVGNGWYAQTVYVDGEPQGSNLSQGKPGNKVSPYTINQAQKTFSGNRTAINYDNPEDGDNHSTVENEENPDYEDWRRRLSPIADTSFPVVELPLIRKLTDALLWLNRKIEETVRVDLIPKISNGVPSITHVVDFTERIRLDGKEYYLVSNQINFTPRKLIQKLTLVRWYAP